MALRYIFLSAVAFVALSLGHAQGKQSAPQAIKVSGDVAGTHDPSIAVENGTYYVFATGAVPPEGASSAAPPEPDPARHLHPKKAQWPQLPIRCSSDLQVWKKCGTVFPAIPAWIQAESPGTAELWAPDISFFNGIYHLYYAFSLFGMNTSGIALATNETLDQSSPKYKWIDRGLVLESVQSADFNAIDPNLILDKAGDAWLAFGSFWTGIKMRHLDRATGLLSLRDTKIYSLASRKLDTTSAARNPDLPPDTEAVEAPFLFRSGKYFYLFVSWDLCCRGARSTYRTMVGRSKHVTGPYVDRTGRALLEGGGTPVLTANATWVGPGGESLLQLATQDVMVFHAYSAADGHPSLHISTVHWSHGWPEVKLDLDQP